VPDIKWCFFSDLQWIILAAYYNTNLNSNPMKQFLFILSFYIPFICASGQTLDWANLLRGDGHEVDAAMSVDVDLGGNVYVCGYFYDTVDFDPGPAVTQLIPIGDNDVFFAKYTDNGNLLWCKSFGAPSSLGNGDVAISIEATTDALYLAGWYSGTADFDPSSQVHSLTSVYFQDGFVSKFDLNGNFIWVRSIDPPFSGFKMDINGNIYLLGNIDGQVDLDPGAGIFNATSSTPGAFLLKLDTAGQFVDAKTFSGTNSIGFLDMAFDQIGSVYLSGFFYDTVDFDPGSGIHNLTTQNANNPEAFLLKLDANVSFPGVKSIG